MRHGHLDFACEPVPPRVRRIYTDIGRAARRTRQDLAPLLGPPRARTAMQARSATISPRRIPTPTATTTRIPGPRSSRATYAVIPRARGSAPTPPRIMTHAIVARWCLARRGEPGRRVVSAAWMWTLQLRGPVAVVGDPGGSRVTTLEGSRRPGSRALAGVSVALPSLPRPRCTSTAAVLANEPSLRVEARGGCRHVGGRARIRSRSRSNSRKADHRWQRHSSPRTNAFDEVLADSSSRRPTDHTRADEVVVDQNRAQVPFSSVGARMTLAQSITSGSRRIDPARDAAARCSPNFPKCAWRDLAGRRERRELDPIKRLRQVRKGSGRHHRVHEASSNGEKDLRVPERLSTKIVGTR